MTFKMCEHISIVHDLIIKYDVSSYDYNVVGNEKNIKFYNLLSKENKDILKQNFIDHQEGCLGRFDGLYRFNKMYGEEHKMDTNKVCDGLMKYLKEKYSNHRMYILIKEEIPLGKAINSVAHGAIGANELWKDREEYMMWKSFSFKKITCKLTPQQFETIYKVMKANNIDYLEQTESTLDGAHTLTVVFPIDKSKPEFKAFNFLSLYK